MIETLTAFAINYGIQIVGGAIGTAILGWILKKIPFDKFGKWAEKIGKAQGTAITRFFNNWKWTKSFYEKLIEPIIIDFVNAVCFAWVKGFIAGLKSDN